MVFDNSCKKNSETPQGNKTILSITFSQKYLNPLFTAVIFISDPQGNLIADTTFKGDGLLEVRVPETTVIPANLMVTVVSPELGAHRANIYLNTYLYPAATAWTLTGSRPDTLGHATISLTNLPPLTGPVLYSASGFFNYTSSVTAKPVMLYKNPDNLFVKISTNSGTKFRWIPGIELSNDYIIDMSSAEAVTAQTIALPAPMVSYEARINGFTGDGFDSPVPYTAAIEIGGGYKNRRELGFAGHLCLPDRRSHSCNI
jgi:hypothetical protein